MLDGITILYAYEQTISVALVILIWLGAVIGIILTILTIVRICNASRLTGTNCLFFLGALSLTILLLFGAFACTADVGSKTIYKVTIDENVSYKEFTRLYEVIEVEGEIYTITEIIQEKEPTTATTPTTWNPEAVG